MHCQLSSGSVLGLGHWISPIADSGPPLMICSEAPKAGLGTFYGLSSIAILELTCGGSSQMLLPGSPPLRPGILTSCKQLSPACPCHSLYTARLS